jgi:hypothetical protein
LWSKITSPRLLRRSVGILQANLKYDLAHDDSDNERRQQSCQRLALREIKQIVLHIVESVRRR